jgi:hypothetical protein
METWGRERVRKKLIEGLPKVGGGESKEKRKPKKTVPVDLNILDEIRRGIKRARGSGKCVWSACLLAFWGSFRLGEIFAGTAENFDKFSDFLWKDVKVKKGGEMILKIRGGKLQLPQATEPNFTEFRKVDSAWSLQWKNWRPIKKSTTYGNLACQSLGELRNGSGQKPFSNRQKFPIRNPLCARKFPPGIPRESYKIFG